MEESAVCWFSDLEFDSLDQLFTQNTWEGVQHYSESYGQYSFAAPNMSRSLLTVPACVGRPKKLAKMKSWDSSCTDELSSTLDPHSSSPTILSFGNQGSSGTKRSYKHMAEKKVANIEARPPHIQEHVLAERKRREKLSKKFIALSAVVPDLKKMDKASILDDAIKHMKQLQDKVRSLEDQAAKSKVNSAVLMQKSQLLVSADDTSSCDEDSQITTDQAPDEKNYPDITARVSNRSVLIRIHCENHKGVLVKSLTEIESLNLVITNTSVIHFAGSFDVTVMAQIEEGFSVEVKELVKKLNSAFRPPTTRLIEAIDEADLLQEKPIHRFTETEVS